MSGTVRARATRYARAVERAWSELPGVPGILSPRDFRLVEDWCGRGVPLQLVLEAIEAAAERLTRGSKQPRRPRGLSYIAAAVEESWRVVLEGRLSAQPAPQKDGEIPAAAIDAWRVRLSAESPDSPLGRLLAELMGRLDQGTPKAELDRSLDEQIEASSNEELLQRTSAEVDLELETYRGRMPADAFNATRRKARIKRLRAALGLPRLDR